MIFRRRKRQREQILQQSAEADQHLELARELSAELEQLAAQSREARRRNHFGESIAASFQPKPRKIRPWFR